MDSFGIECSKSCPEGYHGVNGEEKCLCNTTQYIVGCNTTTGACSNVTNKILCIGGTGHDCLIPCPKGYYGEGCREKCLCEDCDRTGACADKKTTGLSLVSLAVLAVGGILFVATCAVCVMMKRRLFLNVNRNYVQESFCPNDATSQSYAKVDENVYNECEGHSLGNTASTKSSRERHYNTYDVPQEDVQKTAKPSILALLRRKDNSDTRITKSEYIHVVETQGPFAEPASGSAQPPSVPPQTSSQEVTLSNSKKLSCSNIQQRITFFENQHKKD
ncbi:uncharacterized protein LOC134258982 [Saccostrea cucullata]|uniref:uncharacterized protein LOC134258982 n=1 Tax=Saccostrea cuccullata TaxID=36930 RepID=UPI002ED38944